MERRVPLVGRDRQVGVVADALRPACAAGPLFLTGAAGAGKTAVLDEARHMVVQEGATVLRPVWETVSGPGGAATLADAVCGVLAEVHHGRFPTHISAVRRAQSRLADGGELTLLSTLGEALADAAYHDPFALVLDGVERMPPATASALQLMLRVFRPAGLSVVLAGRPVSWGPEVAPDLATAADRVLDLPPLGPDEVGELVGRRLGRPAEPALLAAVRHSLGPLAGNPEAVLSVLTALHEDGGLVDLDGRTGLAGTEDDLRLTVDAEPLRRVTADGMDAVVLAGLLHRAELRLEDVHSLSPACPTLTTDLGRTVDRLVRERVLTLDGDGRLAFAVPALAAALRTLLPRRDVRSVHAAVVQAVAGRLGPATAGVCHPLLADHVAAAGSELNDAVAVPLLLAAAGKDARSHHPRAARAYLSALRRLPPNYPATLGVLREAAELGLGCGDHAGVLTLGEPILAGLRDPGPTDGGLEFATIAWGLSSLHEHRSPYDGGAVPGAVFARMPRAAMLAALGGRYAIGPLTPWPSSTEPAPDDDGRLRDGHGALPSQAELRTLAAAVGGHEELARALRDRSEGEACEAAVGRLRDAAAYGDLAGALEAVLGERYVRAGHSTAGRYHAMVRDYLAGRWDDALAAARGIERRGRADGGQGTAQLARALAAEIHCFRGDLVRAREWLDLIPGSVVHPLAARARLGVRYWSGQQDAALEEAWRDVRRVRGSGLLAGVERVLLRILEFAEETRPRQARQALEQLAALHAEVDTAMTREALLVARGVLHRDADGAYEAYRSAERRGDRHMMLYCCQILAEVADEPQSWLAEAARHTHLLSLGRPGRVLLGRSAQRRNVPLPRGRAAREGLSEADIQLIGMVGEGGTNRQIAARLACSEKTVEQRLARLFQRSGKRSRVELVAAWLDGSLAGLGRLPE
ncbi:AAA family ATPase [Streptomyces decoyicus]|uniref:helix-turn-helix transcriptional regulator n=1 Tax=Streptomyces decoyicus TaxID=249567 RepID=UPI00363D93DD